MLTRDLLRPGQWPLFGQCYQAHYSILESNQLDYREIREPLVKVPGIRQALEKASDRGTCEAGCRPTMPSVPKGCLH